MIKAVLLDFDGTLVSEDVLSLLCGIVGKQEESEQLDRDFISGQLQGLDSLILRINLLQGVSLAQIGKKLDEQAYLMEGAEDLLHYLREHHIVSIVYSGNLLPVLEHYQQLLGIDHVLGSRPRMDGDKIAGIGEEDFPGRQHKLLAIQGLLTTLSIQPSEALAVGDSPADLSVMELVGQSVAINPKGGIKKKTDHVIDNDLRLLIPIIEQFNAQA